MSQSFIRSVDGIKEVMRDSTTLTKRIKELTSPSLIQALTIVDKYAPMKKGAHTEGEEAWVIDSDKLVRALEDVNGMTQDLILFGALNARIGAVAAELAANAMHADANRTKVRRQEYARLVANLQQGEKVVHTALWEKASGTESYEDAKATWLEAEEKSKIMASFHRSVSELSNNLKLRIRDMGNERRELTGIKRHTTSDQEA